MKSFSSSWKQITILQEEKELQLNIPVPLWYIAFFHLRNMENIFFLLQNPILW